MRSGPALILSTLPERLQFRCGHTVLNGLCDSPRSFRYCRLGTIDAKNGSLQTLSSVLERSVPPSQEPVAFAGGLLHFNRGSTRLFA